MYVSLSCTDIFAQLNLYGFPNIEPKMFGKGLQKRKDHMPGWKVHFMQI